VVQAWDSSMRQGADLTLISEPASDQHHKLLLAGHQSLLTTQRYIDGDSDVQRPERRATNRLP